MSCVAPKTLLFLLRHSCLRQGNGYGLLLRLNFLRRLADIKFALLKLTHNFGDLLGSLSLLHLADFPGAPDCNFS